MPTPDSIAIRALCAALLAPPAAHGADWNSGTGGNPARNSFTTERGPDEPDILWTGSLPAIVAQQAVIEGDLVVMARITSFDLPNGTTIVAHDLHTGAERWTQQLPYDFPGSSWRSRVSAIRNGLVYATRAGNTNLDPMYALDVADGSIVWQSQHPIDEATTESASFAPDGDLIVGNFTTVRRIEWTDGTTVWTAPRACPTTNGCEACVFGARVYLWNATADGPKVTALDLATGHELYSGPPIGGGFIRQVGLMVGPDGTVYAPRTQNNPITDFFVAFEDTGRALVEKWSIPMGYTPFASFGVGPDGSVYTYSPDQTILRLDPATGRPMNESDPVPGLSSPRMAIDNLGRIFLTNGGFPDGALFSFNADLTLRWMEPITNVNLGGPAVGSNGVLVVCGVGTDVRAYQTAGGPLPGDVNGDGAVDVADLVELLVSWGPCPEPPEPCPADIDGDGDVDVGDLVELFVNWGP
jgi:outer membrane protein assembly factor BamB